MTGMGEMKPEDKFKRKEAKPNVVVEGIGVEYGGGLECGCWNFPDSEGFMPCPRHRRLGMSWQQAQREGE